MVKPTQICFVPLSTGISIEEREITYIHKKSKKSDVLAPVPPRNYHHKIYEG